MNLTKTEQKILTFLFSRPEEYFYMRQLAEYIQMDPGNLNRTLKKMLAADILKQEPKGMEKYYGINKEYPLYNEYKKIIFKTSGIQKKLEEILETIENINFAFIFGSYAKGQESNLSDIDLFIIGEIDQDVLIRKISALEKELNREINYHIYSLNDFKTKFKKNSFLQNIIKKYILLKGDEREFKKLF